MFNQQIPDVVVDELRYQFGQLRHRLSTKKYAIKVYDGSSKSMPQIRIRSRLKPTRSRVIKAVNANDHDRQLRAATSYTVILQEIDPFGDRYTVGSWKCDAIYRGPFDHDSQSWPSAELI